MWLNPYSEDLTKGLPSGDIPRVPEPATPQRPRAKQRLPRRRLLPVVSSTRADFFLSLARMMTAAAAAAALRPCPAAGPPDPPADAQPCLHLPAAIGPPGTHGRFSRTAGIHPLGRQQLSSRQAVLGVVVVLTRAHWLSSHDVPDRTWVEGRGWGWGGGWYGRRSTSGSEK